MYYLIGADSREYGPFTAEQIGDWVAQGRANAHSRIRRESETTWQALKDLPEFANLGVRPALSDGAPPPQLTPEAVAAEYLRRNVVVDIGNCISRGWSLVRDNLGLLVGATALVWLVAFGIAMVPILGAIAGIFINPVLMGGLFLLFLRRIRGESPTVGDAFAGFNIALLHLGLAGLVSSLLIGLGVLLCVIPGIYLAVGYAFVLPLVIEKKLDFWTAMETSRRVVHQQWFTIFGLAIVAVLICVAGILACIVGLLVAAPVAIASMMYAYDDIFGRV
jgi:uncharacterized protein DUF4339